MQAAPIGNFIAHKIVLQCWQPYHYISSVLEHFIQIANKGTTKAISLLGSNEITEFAAITLTYHSAYIAPALTRALQKHSRLHHLGYSHITKALVQVQRPYRPQRPFTLQTPKSQNTSKSQNKLQVDYCPLFSISIRPLTSLAGGAAAFFISFFLTGVFFLAVFLFLADADFFFT